MRSVVFNPTWARFPSAREQSWASTRPFEEGEASACFKPAMEAWEEERRKQPQRHMFMPSTGSQSFQDNISKAVMWETQFVAVPAVSSYQWTSPRSRCTLEHESWGGKAEHKESRTKDVAMAEALSSDSRKHHFGEMLPEEECVYGVKVIENCLNTVQALLGWHGVSPVLCSNFPAFLSWTNVERQASHLALSISWTLLLFLVRGGGGVHDQGHWCWPRCLYDV